MTSSDTNDKTDIAILLELIKEQITKQEHKMAMSELQKEDCISIDDAAKEIDVSRATLYNYMNYLRVQRLKFPFDRRTFIPKSDLPRIKELAQGKSNRE